VPARRLSARWLVPVEGPPVEYGAVLIGTDGRIVAAGRDADVPRPLDTPEEAYGEAALLPGLVNTHTHLELTGLEWQQPEAEFASWIGRIRRVKAERSAEAFLAAARAGIREGWAAGVTTVADTGDSGAVIQALADLGGSGVAYQEVFGPDPSQVAESMAGLRDRVERLGRFAGGRVAIGVSPHAPYSVSGALYRATAVWAMNTGLPLAAHVAESPAESELLATGTGAFAEGWRARGVPMPAPLGRTPVAWLEQHGVLSDRALCIHAVRVGHEDVRRLASAGAAVAHCPLSNAAHGHGAAPLARLLDAGVRVGLGTDSVLSVGVVDLLAEARAAAALGGLDADRALSLLTLDGARALGLEREIGSLGVGKWGDCVVIRLRAAPGGVGPAERVLAAGPGDVLTTYVGGRDVYRANRPV
jgi:cytosine/adenosine deaminase-related metal-dependent hydrolase